MKKKRTASLLALLFGIVGIHRFYLGERVKGFLHLGLFFMMMVATVEENAPFIFIPAILGFIDAVLFFVKPTEEFDEKYNAKYLRDQPRPQSRRDRLYESRMAREPREHREPKRRRVNVEPVNSFKESGMRKFDEYDVQGAIIDFRKALNADFKDSKTHYLMACCYSINEEPEKSLFHLDKAVDFGYVDFETIHESDALAFLRTHVRFEEFVKNSYQIPRYLPEEQDQKLDLMEDEKATDLLDQIASLGALYEKGVLTPDEFQEQKQKLLDT
ncbi:MAG: NINE protein [Saprospiraceae bacterium]